MTHSVPLLDLWWTGPGLWFDRENRTTHSRVVGESVKIDRRASWNDLGRIRFCPDISNGYPQADERVSGDLSAFSLGRNPRHNAKVWVELTTGRAGHSFAWQRRVPPKQVRSWAVNLWTLWDVIPCDRLRTARCHAERFAMTQTSTGSKSARCAPRFSRPFTGFRSSTTVGKIQHGVIPNRETHHVRTA